MKIKRASKDFTINDLPSTRKEVFFDCLKNRFRYLFRCGIYLFLTCIPLLIIVLIKNVAINGINEALINGEIVEKEYNIIFSRYMIMYDILIVVSGFIISIGISGVSRIIRQLGWEEPLFFNKDFSDGIKMNYKFIAVHIFILTVVYLISDVAINAGEQFSLLRYIPILIFYFIIIPLVLYSIAQVNIYDISTTKTIKNSLLFFLKSVPVCIIFSLFIVFTSLVNLIPNFSIGAVIYILIIIFIVPIFYLLWFLYSSYVFDKEINKTYYPEIVDKGISRKNNEQ